MIKTYKDVLPTFDGYIIDAETCSIHPVPPPPAV
jgi:hypothetical protein